MMNSSQINRSNAFQKCSNAQLPDSSLNLDQIRSQQANLAVPNQDVPYGDQTMNIFLRQHSDQYFVCPDGTIVDIKHKKIYSKKEEMKTICSPIESRYQQWNSSIDNNILDLVNQISSGNIQDYSEDSRYWKHADEQSKIMQDNMSEEAKRMLKQFEESHKTKFEDDNA